MANTETTDAAEATDAPGAGDDDTQSAPAASTKTTTASGSGNKSAGGDSDQAESGAAEDASPDVIFPERIDDEDLRRRCSVDLNAAQPKDRRALRVWTAGRKLRQAESKVAEAAVALRDAMKDHLGATRSALQEERAAQVSDLAAGGIDMARLAELAKSGKLAELAPDLIKPTS